MIAEGDDKKVLRYTKYSALDKAVCDDFNANCKKSHRRAGKSHQDFANTVEALQDICKHLASAIRH